MVPRLRKRKKMDSTVLLLGFLIFGSLNCASASFTILGPDTPVIVSAGDDALLRCRLSIDDALTEARWFRIQSNKASIIYLYKAGKDQQESQIPSYAGRTELLRENITHGDVSLNISKIGPSDEGQYRCLLKTDTYFDWADFELKVTDQYFEKPSEVSTIIKVFSVITALSAVAAALRVYLCFKKHERSAKGNSESDPLKICEEGNSEIVPLKTCEEESQTKDKDLQIGE